MADTDRTISTRGDNAFGRILTAAKGSTQQVTAHTDAGTFRGYVFDYSYGMAELRNDGEIFHVRVNHITTLQLHGAARKQENS